MSSPTEDSDAIATFQTLYPRNPKDAIEQTAEFLGFLTGVEFDLGNGETWTLPNPSLMGDEQEDRYNQALLDIQNETEQLDRESDVLDDEGQFVRKGNVKTPERIDGKLVANQNVRIAVALMTQPIYDKFKAAGGSASHITQHWGAMGKFMRERQAADSKSAGGNATVAPVPDGTGV